MAILEYADHYVTIGNRASANPIPVEYPPHQREAKFVRFKDCTADLESFEDSRSQRSLTSLHSY